MQVHILLLEDDPGAGAALRDYLCLQHYRVTWTADGDAALKQLRAHKTELHAAVLDVMVPGANGTEVLRYIRETARWKALPVLMLTARDAEREEIEALQLGADDYLVKPASLARVAARVQRLLARAGQMPASELKTGKLRLLPARREAKLGRKTILLTSTEVRLLEVFLRQPNKIFSREELLAHVIEDDKPVFDRTVDAHVKNLRAKLGDEAGLIKTYRGLGYGLQTESEPQ